MNYNDFYVIKAFGKKLALRAILKTVAGRIDTRKVGMKQYGYQSFPVWEHSITLGHVNVSGKKESEIQSEIAQIADKFKEFVNVKVHAQYVAID